MSLKDNATWKAVKPFMNGGLSGMGATCIIQPLDIVKVRAVTSTPPRRREGRADCARRRDDRRRATPAATPRGAFPRCLRRRYETRPRPFRTTRAESLRGPLKAPIARATLARSPRSPSSLPRFPISPSKTYLRRTQTRRRSNEPQVRLQLGATGGPFSVATSIIKNEGFGTLYTGLSAGLLRQATYTTARLGIHAKIVDFLKEQNKGAPLPLVQKAGAGLAAGGLGAIFGSPADLSLIRMQADGTLPAAERRNYTGVGHALTDIVKKEGVGGLFVGASTTAVRAMALNMGMLASNDQAKEMMKDNGITGFPATLGASAIAGFFASFFSLPFDYVKTQLQKQKPLPDGTLPFRGFGDCVAKTMAAGGPLKFYTGFPTYYVRIAPHAMFTLIILDQINATQKAMGA